MSQKLFCSLREILDTLYLDESLDENTYQATIKSIDLRICYSISLQQMLTSVKRGFLT